MNNKILSVILILVAVALVGYGAWVFFAPVKSPANTQTACTQEAKQCADGSYVSRTGANCAFEKCPVINTAGWQTYTDQANGFSFQYPASFSSDFARFQSQPTAVVSTTADANGCAGSPAGDGDKPQESKTTIGGRDFCLATSSGVGAGQLYPEYDYTTFENEKYVTLQYVVHTPNGCGAYEGTSNSQACTDFMNNEQTIVVKPIEESVSTLTFTK